MDGSNEERGAERLMDEYLKTVGLHRKRVAKDGSCLFRAVAEQVKRHLRRDFLIFQEPGKPAVNITDNNFKDKVRLCFLNGNHYDSVYPITHIQSAALCQSIVYELLYDGVFKVERSFLGPCQRMSRPSDVLSDDSMPVCGSSDESDLDAGEALWVENGTSSTTTRHHSYRVKRMKLIVYRPAELP
ncbi:OTU domain-containing protein 4 [Morone saxatilis]|uniref:OTU domain-containing protein 4 n=1 Tax=Morone saxatilis TaxID=34816 RepID=UPI0015E24149|nr:OTU domain-containing protein 4 [Morone saxatilis]